MYINTKKKHIHITITLHTHGKYNIDYIYIRLNFKKSLVNIVDVELCYIH